MGKVPAQPDPEDQRGGLAPRRGFQSRRQRERPPFCSLSSSSSSSRSRGCGADGRSDILETDLAELASQPEDHHRRGVTLNQTERGAIKVISFFFVELNQSSFSILISKFLNFCIFFSS